MAGLDGHIDKDELKLLFELIDLEGLSHMGRQQAQGFLITPPALTEALQPFAVADPTLRFALLLNLLEVAWANDLLDPAQEQALAAARLTLGLTPEQYTAIQRFVQQLREVRTRGLDDDAAAEAVKSATAGLAAVGVPIAAVYVSGSVFGLSAAGITSGLAALGLGLGMVPGIGMAILLGTGIYMSVRWLLDANNERAKEQLRQEAVRKAQLVIQNLQECINLLIERMAALQHAAATTDVNRERITELEIRLQALQQILAQRRHMAETLGS